MQTAPSTRSTSAPTSVERIYPQLPQLLSTWAFHQSFSSAIVVTELNGHRRTAVYAGSTRMITASTYKIFVAYATLHRIEQGKISLDTRTRTGESVKNALDKMMLQSDNSSAEALGFLVGWDAINSLAASVGATHTDINNYNAAGLPEDGDKYSTAPDLALMLTKLQQGTLLNEYNTSMLLRLMENQIYRERIPAGVPAGTVVADKPGWLSNVQNDAAIVYGPQSIYVLAIMTNGSNAQPLAELSQLVYEAIET